MFFLLVVAFFRLLHIIQSVENRRDVVDDGFRFGVVRGDTGKVLKLLNGLDLLSIHSVSECVSTRSMISMHNGIAGIW